MNGVSRHRRLVRTRTFPERIEKLVNERLCPRPQKAKGPCSFTPDDVIVLRKEPREYRHVSVTHLPWILADPCREGYRSPGAVSPVCC
ncbi:hypothetical protein ABIE56_000228 [Luteibacter sp. 621]